MLQNNTAPAAQIHSQNFNYNSITNPHQQIHHITMSANESPQNSPTASPQTPRVTFRTQSTPIATTSTSHSNTQASSSPDNQDIELSREEIFENNLNQLFTKSFLAVLTSKDQVLKEIRDCVIQDDEARCKEVSPYVHSFWKDLHVKSGCLCVDQRVAIPNSNKEAVLESIHMTHPGIWGMISLSLSLNMHGGHTCIGRFWPELQIVFRVRILVRISNLLSQNLNGIRIRLVKNLMKKFRLTLRSDTK